MATKTPNSHRTLMQKGCLAKSQKYDFCFFLRNKGMFRSCHRTSVQQDLYWHVRNLWFWKNSESACQFTPASLSRGMTGFRAGWRLVTIFLPLGYGASQLTDCYIAPCTRISIRLAFWGMGFSLWLRGVRYPHPSAIRYDRSIGKTGFSASRAIPQS